MKKKLAFCFLTYGDLHASSLWESFFKDADPDAYNIYIHSKEDITSPYVIPDRVPTTYRHISIVRATLHLFRQAYTHDVENQSFILLSDACIPLVSFSVIYDFFLHRQQQTVFTKKVIHPKRCRRFQSLRDTDFFKDMEYLKTQQWFTLARDHVLFFIENDFTDLVYGDDTLSSNEHYFINLCHRFDLPYTIAMYHFTNWCETSDDPRYHSKPKTYTSMTRQYQKMLIDQGYLFMRKVSPDFVIL